MSKRSKPFSPGARGVTLLELLILGLLAVAVAASLLPWWTERRMASNETAALSALRLIAQAEERFRRQREEDLDGNGQGEFTWLGTLAGSNPLRRDLRPDRPFFPERKLSPPLLPAAWGRHTPAGEVVFRGYLFLLCLPLANGKVLAEPPRPDLILSRPADAALQERYWAVYAWPLQAGKTGMRAFFTRQTGTLYHCLNLGYRAADTPYDGPFALPAVRTERCFAADDDTPVVLSRPVGTATGNPPVSGSRDGQIWLEIKESGFSAGR